MAYLFVVDYLFRDQCLTMVEEGQLLDVIVFVRAPAWTPVILAEHLNICIGYTSKKITI